MIIKMTDLAAEVCKVATDNPDVLYRKRAKDMGVPTREHDPYMHYCRYQAGGEGCCLVGVALANLGVPIERLAEYDADHETSIDGVVMQFADDFEIDDEDAYRLVCNAQYRQDDDTVWGECVPA